MIECFREPVYRHNLLLCLCHVGLKTVDAKAPLLLLKTELQFTERPVLSHIIVLLSLLSRPCKLSEPWRAARSVHAQT